LVPAEHRAFLDACREFHETESHIFAHANYYPDLPMAEQCVAMLRWESLREFTPGPHDSGKKVILGHSSQKSGEILDLGHLVCIDTFCHGGGWLSALDVGTGKVWQADQHGRMRSS
jgi:serine/threonine protein phosphatase 1